MLRLLFPKSILLALVFALPLPVTAKEAGRGVEPIDEWNCPQSHPIKGNINPRKGTMIYHLPGGYYYDRTKPEKCFITEEDAKRAGFRKSKR